MYLVPYPGWKTAAVAADPFDAAYLTNSVDTSDLTSYTFSSLSLGNAATSRIILAAISGISTSTASRTISSVTIAGVSGTLVTSSTVQGNGASTDAVMGFYTAAVPTGTSGSVEVTFSAGMSSAHCALFRMTGVNSTATAVATDAAMSSGVLTGSLTIPSGGVGIGVAVAHITVTGSSWTNLTEQFVNNSGTRAYSGGLSTTAGAATRSVDMGSSTENVGCFSMVAFAPS